MTGRGSLLADCVCSGNNSLVCICVPLLGCCCPYATFTVFQLSTGILQKHACVFFIIHILGLFTFLEFRAHDISASTKNLLIIRNNTDADFGAGSWGTAATRRSSSYIVCYIALDSLKSFYPLCHDVTPACVTFDSFSFFRYQDMRRHIGFEIRDMWYNLGNLTKCLCRYCSASIVTREQ